MKVKLPIRWISRKQETKEDKEERRLKRLLAKEDDEEDGIEQLIKYDYHWWVGDLTDIRTFAEYDDEHTTIGLINGDFYVTNIKFSIFESFYTFLTGQEIKNINSFNFAKEENG